MYEQSFFGCNLLRFVRNTVVLNNYLNGSKLGKLTGNLKTHKAKTWKKSLKQFKISFLVTIPTLNYQGIS